MRWNPTNTLALSRWLTTRRTAQSPAEYACALERAQRNNPSAERIASVLLAVAIGVMLAVAIVYGWSLQ